MDELIKQLQEVLGRARGTEMLAEKPGMKAVPFSLDYFRALPDAEIKDVFFIDGGQATLFETPEMLIGVIRIAVIKQNGNRTALVERQQNYVVIHTSFEESGLCYEAMIVGGQSFKINPNESALKDGVVRASFSKVLDVLRKKAELDKAAEHLGESLVVLDGELDAKAELEKESLSKLKGKIVGVVKSQSQITNTGASLYSALLDMAPESSWWYWPVMESKNADWIIAKLSSESYQPYRIEMLPKANKEEILAILRTCSQDLSLPGYPYGLLVADQHARVSEQEAALLKTMLVSELSKETKLLKDSFDTHEMLNRIVLRLSR